MSEVLTVGSLFAGVGGFDLGLERAGMRVVWQCEQDPFCRRVLARHWPGVPCYPDVRALVANAADQPADVHAGLAAAADLQGGHESRNGDSGLSVPVPYVDVLCGGFPCQDLSYAGRGAGLAGERSGLWRHFARLIGELRPRYVLVENVPALTSRGLDVVLGDLAACGFDAEWDHLPASAFGAPHRRDRIWLVAYPQEPGLERTGLPGRPAVDGPWLTEPDVGRVAHGVPARVDRLRALGNALVSQIAEWIGRQIISWESAPLSPSRWYAPPA